MGICGAGRGATLRYFFGYDDKDMCRYGDGYHYTSPAGHFLPNGFGLYHMHGNAWQWVEDCCHDSHIGAPSDRSALRGRRCLLTASCQYDKLVLFVEENCFHGMPLNCGGETLPRRSMR
jgi:formylglycine-generating enzyme required for sulfatase activity